MDKHYRKVQAQAVLIGAICGTLLVGLPAMAKPRMMKAKHPMTNPNPTVLKEPTYNRSNISAQSPQNPHPSIFDEPPYKQSDSGSMSQPGMSPMQSMPESGSGGSMTPSMPSGNSQMGDPNSLQNSNPPAEAPSPGASNRDPSSSMQPSKPGTKTTPQNPPAEAPSPGTSNRDPSSSTQPKEPMGTAPRAPSTSPVTPGQQN